MKKIFSVVLSFAMSALMVLNLTACSGSEGVAEETTDFIALTDENGEEVTDEEGNVVTSNPDELPPEKALTVGFIYSEGVEDSVISKQFNNARLQAEKTLGAETYYIEGVLVSQFPDAVDVLVEKGCNVIVSCSAKFKNAVKKEAQVVEDVSFISYGGDDSLSNMSSFQGKLYQSIYVCGIAGAYNSSTNVLGVLADSSLANCYGIINAYIQGAKELTELDTDVRLNWCWASNESTVKNAIDDLADQGCDVIFACTESEYALEYCNERGIKVIGLAYNLPEIAPDTYLTGAFYNFGTYLIDMLRRVRYETGTFNVICEDGLAEGAARVIAISENCAEGTAEITDKLYQLVNENRAKIFAGEIKDNYDNIRVEKGTTLSHSEIWEINWLDKCVTKIEDFTVPVLEPPLSELQVME